MKITCEDCEYPCESDSLRICEKFSPAEPVLKDDLPEYKMLLRLNESLAATLTEVRQRMDQIEDKYYDDTDE
jgi:hypothetical protein